MNNLLLCLFTIESITLIKGYEGMTTTVLITTSVEQLLFEGLKKKKKKSIYFKIFFIFLSCFE